jgi:hypothetical protein
MLMAGRGDRARTLVRPICGKPRLSDCLDESTLKVQ